MEHRDQKLEQQLAHALNGLGFGHPCYAFQEAASTMDVARQAAEQGAAEGTCVWAETQTGGRGRAGRPWASPPGGIYLSLIVRPMRDVRDVPQLALVAGVAVAQTIQEVTGLWASLRWPNDVLLYEQKVAGILVEASSSSTQQLADSRQNYAVVGIGMNVTTARGDLPDGATALGQWVNPVLDRTALFGTLMRGFEQVYRQWERDGFAPIRPQLTRWIGLFGRLVHITTTQGAFQGQALDLDDSGRLMVRLDSGLIRPVEMGEVTLLDPAS